MDTPAEQLEEVHGGGSNNQFTGEDIEGELQAPKITVTGAQEDGVYIGKVKVTIEDTVTDGSKAIAINYTLNANESRPTWNKQYGTNYTKTIEESGTYVVQAYMEDLSGNKSGKCIPVAFEIDMREVDITEQEGIIGAYVDYKPAGVDYTAYSTYTGYVSNQIFRPQNAINNPNNAMQWRIWSINEEEGRIYLISDRVTEQALWLTGADGYNNGVLELNNICSANYGQDGETDLSKKYTGLKVRNLNIEDIEKVITYRPMTGVTTSGYKKHGSTASCVFTTSLTPKIWNDYDSVDGMFVRSKQEVPYSGCVDPGTFTILVNTWAQTYKEFPSNTEESGFVDINYTRLVHNPSTSDSTKRYAPYWLSSRSTTYAARSRVLIQEFCDFWSILY